MLHCLTIIIAVTATFGIVRGQYVDSTIPEGRYVDSNNQSQFRVYAEQSIDGYLATDTFKFLFFYVRYVVDQTTGKMSLEGEPFRRDPGKFPFAFPLWTMSYNRSLREVHLTAYTYRVRFRLVTNKTVYHDDREVLSTTPSPTISYLVQHLPLDKPLCLSREVPTMPFDPSRFTFGSKHLSGILNYNDLVWANIRDMKYSLRKRSDGAIYVIPDFPPYYRFPFMYFNFTLEYHTTTSSLMMATKNAVHHPDGSTVPQRRVFNAGAC
ncbi:hypothetical protein FOL47_002775 [Perkinsus chesapeaki]|uniref:Secreted protein n=1 Tax=Perkinsus chesapeaki TaxID=330153 RepID=A0A7J6N021_PERCH|nr:hypothetical protein FOL47_002775 [Perkinsus chesapeaki]